MSFAARHMPDAVEPSARMAARTELNPPLASGGFPISLADAEGIAAEHYGLRVRARRLPGEKDQNFALVAQDRRYFLKVAPDDEPRPITNLITSALIHLADTAPAVPVQRVLLATSGEPEVVFTSEDGRERVGRLTSFLEGQPLGVSGTQDVRRKMGGALADLAKALRGFRHPAMRRDLIWDLQQSGRARGILRDLAESSNHGALAACIERFNAVVHPRLVQLPAQPVHNDLNPRNILVSPTGTEVVGILDLGDLVYTQRVNDVAIAATHQLADGEDPLAPALDVVRGYHEVTPLTREEVGLIYDLIRTRLAVIAAVAEWRCLKAPNNDEYRTRNSPWSRSMLARLSIDDAPAASGRLFELCTPSQERT